MRYLIEPCVRHALCALMAVLALGGGEVEARGVSRAAADAAAGSGVEARPRVALHTGADAGAAPAWPRRAELHFEMKLLLRERVLWRRVALDQWAGARLLMSVEPGQDESIRPGVWLKLLHPLEHAWTFRWYPTKGEAKLGAAVVVESPRGDAYRSLADLVEPLARERHSAWWGDDVVRPTSLRRPAWSAQADHFWADVHRSDPWPRSALPQDPTYPFHVLGPVTERLGVFACDDGSLLAGSAWNDLTTPWLADGWSEWLGGAGRPGYGYWDRDRPAWEPSVYEAVLAALALLDWSPFLGDSPGDTAALGRDAAYRRPAAGGAPPEGGFMLAASEVLQTLVKHAAGRLDWSDTPSLEFRVEDSSVERVEVSGESGLLELPRSGGLRYRVWRYADFDRAAGYSRRDELQLLVTDRNPLKLRLWIKIGLAPR